MDNSLSFSGSTPELTVEQRVAFMELQGKNVRALFEPVDYAPEAKMTVKTEVGLKTPSEQLRGVLFVLYKQECEGKQECETFDSFYAKHMVKFVEHVKSKLKD